MTKLEELLYSLAAVIVRYHDIQPKIKKLVSETNEEIIREKSLLCAKEIIHNKEVPFQTRLNELIKQCVDGSRKPFLHYLLHEITSLKARQEQISSFEPTKLEEYKNQIYQLFFDFKRLLDTLKHKTCKVTYSKIENSAETSIALAGLKNDAYIGPDLCNSGEFLKDGVLKRFNINTSSSTDDMREVAEQICTEHQHALLVPELLVQNAAQKELHDEQEQKINSLTKQLEEEQKKHKSLATKQHLALYLIYLQYRRLQGKDEKQNKALEQQHKTIEDLRQKISDLAHPSDQKSSLNYRFYHP